MLHLELGIQIKQGWQFLYYCQTAIENKLFFHLYIPFFPHVMLVYSHSKLFSKKFLALPLINTAVATKNADMQHLKVFLENNDIDSSGQIIKKIYLIFGQVSG